jgi:hypothetical protein
MHLFSHLSIVISYKVLMPAASRKAPTEETSAQRQFAQVGEPAQATGSTLRFVIGEPVWSSPKGRGLRQRGLSHEQLTNP